MRLTRAHTALCAPLLGLALLAPAVPTSTASGLAAARVDATGTLSVSPDVYVGGQRITLKGNIGRTGQRRVWLQGNMGRSGDTWQNITRGTTDSQGNFTFSVLAPGMFGVDRRVVARDGLRTRAVTLRAQSQDLVLQPDRRPEPGEPFVLRVDTVPDSDSEVYPLKRRPDLPPPVLEGRQLTLQQREGSGWRTLDTTVTDRAGQGEFTVTRAQAGTVVYRVRQENYFRDGHEIGWFPSFPTYVHVGGSGPALPDCDTPNPPNEGRGAFAATTAARTIGWGASLWDFGWSEGESLDSPPSRGTDRRGRWVDASTGTGRAAKHNGGLMLESQRDNCDGRGDVGSTWVTLEGNARRYGRWEARIRLKSSETNARDFRAKVELVPERDDQYRCGGQNITIAELAPHSRRMRFGATSVKAKSRWKGSTRVGDLYDLPLAVAVEVTRQRISWFLNGRVIGSLRNRKAVSDVPLTMRLTLQGRGDTEMNRTEAIFDWMRGYSLDRGKITKRGPRLKVRRFRGGC